MFNITIDYQLILILSGLFFVGYYSWVFYSERQDKLESKITELEMKLKEHNAEADTQL